MNEVSIPSLSQNIFSCVCEKVIVAGEMSASANNINKRAANQNGALFIYSLMGKGTVIQLSINL